jgi:predicted permease
LIAVGYAVSARLRLDLATLTETVVYLAGPALVFHALSNGTISLQRLTLLAGGTAAIIVGVGALVAVAAAVAGVRPGALYLPAMFMNAGNMLLPLSLFAFGEQGLQSAVVIFATATLLQTTLGVAIASGRFRPGETLRLPYLYAAVLGLVVSFSDFDVPEVLGRPIGLLADVAIPLMLISLGLRLRLSRLQSWKRPSMAVLARLGGGYAAGCVVVGISGAGGVERSTLLLASAMPSAVINFVFAEKYGSESAEVAAAVFLSTIASLIVTPLVLSIGI